ncbi:MAG: chromate transporter [Eubacterium sp.]|nr:chromate transporter [Eubacterium sp.]
MKELMRLYGLFFKIGCIMFGGGYAMLALLQKEIAEERNLVSEEELLSYFAVSQCTPGVIAVNTATFIGYKRAGVIGGIAATLGVVSPSVIIISIISKVLTKFAEYEVVQHAFVGIRIAVVALVAQAVYKFMKSAIKDKISAIIFAVSLISAAFFGVSSVIIVVCAVVIGICYGVYTDKYAKVREDE